MEAAAEGQEEERQSTPQIESKRDPIYFLSWDPIFLKVEDTLFKIPRCHLLKHSQYLRDLFKSSSDLQPESIEGFSETNPFIVVDGTTEKEFRDFLRIILPAVTEDLETIWTNKNTVRKDEWISVLKISTLWRCINLRKLAISELESDRPTRTLQFAPTLSPLEKIVLGRKYSICSWVEAGYEAMVRNGFLTDCDMQTIGGTESFKLMRIMNEKLRFPRSALDNSIKETFKEELESIAAEEKAYGRRNETIEVGIKTNLEKTQLPRCGDGLGDLEEKLTGLLD